MKKINFCHIAPTKYLGEVKGRKTHLVLAHLVESDPVYREFYKNEKGIKIMDNSAFEMFKQNKPMLSSDKLIDLAKLIDADYIVMSDYPGEPWEKTRDKAIEMIPQLKAAGFKTFYVPQSLEHDLAGYLESFFWGMSNPNVDLVGLSILGVPIAFGVESSNNLQRYLSRRHILDLVGVYLNRKSHSKKIHCLGLVDGPNEVRLLKKYAEYIYSWDSSSAVWAGLNGLSYDDSPTGLINGKFEKEVDFDFELDEADQRYLNLARDNMKYLDRLCEADQ